MNKKWLQIVGIVFCSCFLFLGGIHSAKAASGSVSVRLSRTSAVVGTTITATVTVSSTDPLGAWQATLVYDSSKLQFISSDTGNGQTMIGAGDGNMRNKTYTFTFKAIASGNASVSINSATIRDWNTEAAIGVSKGSATVRIMTQQEIQDSYSKNNYLSSLTVDGVELSPVFNKETLEYSIDLEPETSRIVVNATVEDKTASLTGTGEIPLSEGPNRIEIKVTAQNGNVRTYVINATVKEYNPIQVTIGDQTYSVVRKKGDLQAPQNYGETTVKINNEDVPAFYSEITKLTLVGLKDATGTIALYRYENDTYMPYKELTFNHVILLEEKPETEDIPKGFVEKQMKIGENMVTVYYHEKLETTLLYGMNVETGKRHFYSYEEQENTLQIYNEKELEQFGSDLNLKLLLILGTTTGLFFCSTITFLILYGKSKKYSKKKELNQEEPLDKEKKLKKEKHRKKKSVIFEEEE